MATYDTTARAGSSRPFYTKEKRGRETSSRPSFVRAGESNRPGGSTGFRGLTEGGTDLKGCWRCGDPSHVSKFCPKKLDEDATKICYGCRRPGHSVQACPNSAHSGVVKCYSCGKEGHASRNCPKPKALEPGESPYRFAECFVCKQKGHISLECPQNASRGVFPHGGGACHRCGSRLHRVRDCPVPASEADKERERNARGAAGKAAGHRADGTTFDFDAELGGAERETEAEAEEVIEEEVEVKKGASKASKGGKSAAAAAVEFISEAESRSLEPRLDPRIVGDDEDGLGLEDDERARAKRSKQEKAEKKRLRALAAAEGGGGFAQLERELLVETTVKATGKTTGAEGDEAQGRSKATGKTRKPKEVAFKG